jgi:predicted amidohydrolase
MVRIAAATYLCECLGSWAAYEDKLSAWVAEAAGQGAELLVFPEWGGVELAGLAGPEHRVRRDRCIEVQTELLPEADALHARLAAAHGVHICAASAMVRREDGAVVNRARLVTPEGGAGVQDKLILTRYEREPYHLAPGREARVFDTALGRIGIAICYDMEFPLIARAMVAAGAEILLAPSSTETLAGYWRVRIGAQARAMEGQCITVHSPTVGEAEWCEGLEVSTGAAGIYAPPDRGFPPTGVLAAGEVDRPGWVHADADLAALAEVRRDGGVLHLAHWVEQEDGRLGAPQAVDLRQSATAPV